MFRLYSVQCMHRKFHSTVHYDTNVMLDFSPYQSLANSVFTAVSGTGNSFDPFVCPGRGPSVHPKLYLSNSPDPGIGISTGSSPDICSSIGASAIFFLVLGLVLGLRMLLILLY
ncbi:hypothetical protein VNO77_22466 [Canavalia gladiata]|uniref:Uncharacterized protein n=1 Tax=Canavalia gladiata TaxID=3824 RepID=A0AAN9L423_CANGL